MKRILNKNLGFTLIEILIVVAIISIITITVIVILNPYQQIAKARDTQRKADLSQIRKALESYYEDNNKYPASTASFQITGAGWYSAWRPYMNLVPKDPVSANRYVYYASSDGQTFYLYANLERGGKDSQACNSAGNNCTNVPSGAGPNNCGVSSVKNCNYGLSSTNVTP